MQIGREQHKEKWENSPENGMVCAVGMRGIVRGVEGHVWAAGAAVQGLGIVRLHVGSPRTSSQRQQDGSTKPNTA